MIHLPILTWFVQKQGSAYITNIYSGSLGTDPKKGCMMQRTFQYTVYARLRQGQPECLCAECFWRGSFGEGLRRIDHCVREFPVTPEGVEQAQAWITEQYSTASL